SPSDPPHVGVVSSCDVMARVCHMESVRRTIAGVIGQSKGSPCILEIGASLEQCLSIAVDTPSTPIATEEAIPDKPQASIQKTAAIPLPPCPVESGLPSEWIPGKVFSYVVSLHGDALAQFIYGRQVPGFPAHTVLRSEIAAWLPKDLMADSPHDLCEDDLIPIHLIREMLKAAEYRASTVTVDGQVALMVASPKSWAKKQAMAAMPAKAKKAKRKAVAPKPEVLCYLRGKEIGKKFMASKPPVKIPPAIRDIFEHGPGTFDVEEMALTLRQADTKGAGEAGAFPSVADAVCSPCGLDLQDIYYHRLRLCAYLEQLQDEKDYESYTETCTQPEYDRDDDALWFHNIRALAQGSVKLMKGGQVLYDPYTAAGEQTNVKAYRGRILKTRGSSVCVDFGRDRHPSTDTEGMLAFMANSAPFTAQHFAINNACTEPLLVHRLVPVGKEEEEEETRDGYDMTCSLTSSLGTPEYAEWSESEAQDESESEHSAYGPERSEGEEEEEEVPTLTPPGTDTDLTGLPDGFTPNRRQREAITGAMNASQDGMPYIVFGPPGTGKTTTLVALAILLLSRGARLLLCAPTNAAANVLASSLLESQPDLKEKMLRVASFGCELAGLPESLRDIIPVDMDGMGCTPRNISAYSCIVATCNKGGSLPMKGPKFTHVIVDEAGSGTESELMCALSAYPSASFILSGDPRQLGPVIRNRLSSNVLGYGISMIERLIADPAMDGHVTMLDENYRNHPSILHCSSAMFYGGELKAHGGARADSMLQSGLLRRKGFPMVFAGVKGRAAQTAARRSWYNMAEADVVAGCARTLIVKEGVPASEVAIITPYRLQSLKINDALEDIGIEGVAVGSVESMQGREFDAVIISTVRTNERDMGPEDIRRVLGFVAHAQRLNVSVTRARALLFVVGDAHALLLDTFWRALLCYIQDHGGVCGDRSMHRAIAAAGAAQHTVTSGFTSMDDTHKEQVVSDRAEEETPAQEWTPDDYIPAPFSATENPASVPDSVNSAEQQGATKKGKKKGKKKATLVTDMSDFLYSSR
ncbi:hypothetical protein KIPB_007875, partial [Kipferlia bialata]